MILRTIRPFLVLALLLAVSGRGETVDRIVAVVGSEAIIESELRSQVLLYQAQLGLSPSEAEVEELEGEVLESMIENRILLVEAEKETLEVDREEVETAMEDAIGEIRERFPTEEDFQNELEKEGMTLRDLKERYREEVKRSLLVQKLVQKRLAPKVSVTHLEVERFYRENPDSIPSEPEAVRLSHILIPILPSEQAERKAQEAVQEILSALEAGVSFSHLAEVHSEDPGSKDKGGDLGYFGRGEMVPEFEQASFSLEVGEITAIRSRFGYHVIRCEGKRENEVRARHILVRVPLSRSDTLRAKDVAEEVRAKAASGEDFSGLVSEYSQDPSTKDRGGELGLFSLEELPPPFDEVVKDLGAGGTAGPILSEFGYHIVKVDEKREARAPTFEEMRDRLKAYLTERKMAEEYEKWMEKLKQKVYVENRLK